MNIIEDVLQKSYLFEHMGMALHWNIDAYRAGKRM